MCVREPVLRHFVHYCSCDKRIKDVKIERVRGHKERKLKMVTL